MTTHTSENLPLLGYNLWWGVSGVAISVADLRALLVAHQFSAYMPEPPTAIEALRRAINRWLKESGAAKAGRGGATKDLVRKVNSRRSETVVYAIVQEEVDLEQLGLDYSTALRISLEKLTPAERAKREPVVAITTTALGDITNDAPNLAAALQPYWDTEKQTYHTADVARVMRQIVDSIPGRTNVRREGGVFFVPTKEEPTLLQIKAMIEALPCDNEGNEPYCTLMPVVDQPRARVELANAVHRSFLSDVEKAKGDLKDLCGKVKEVSLDTLARRLQEYQRLRAQVTTYNDLLQMRQETILEQLGELEAAARALVHQPVEEDDPFADDARETTPKPTGAQDHEEVAAAVADDPFA